MASKPRVKAPRSASVGEVVTIKTLISHKMETGQRKDKSGNVIPRKIINKFECTFNGASVFSCDILPAVSANPYLQFTMKVPGEGEFLFKWTDDDGSVYEKKSNLKIA